MNVEWRIVWCVLAPLAACSNATGSPDDGGPSRADATGSASDAGPSYSSCTITLDVAVSGSDGNPGTAALPLATVAKAASLATAGTCIQVHAGSYHETATIAFTADGTLDSPIVLRSADGPLAAIIDDSGNTVGEGVYINHDHIVIDGLDFQGMPSSTMQQTIHFDGMLAGKGVGSVVRACRITGGYDMLKINQIAGDRANDPSNVILFEGNEMYGSPPHLPISITGGFDLRFQRNYFHDWWTATTVSGDGPIQIKGGSAHIILDGNLFQDIYSLAGAITFGDGCGASCDFDVDHYASVSNLAMNNVMVNVGRAFDFGGARDCAALNNTIVNSATQTVAFKLVPITTNLTTRDCTGTRIINNVIANPHGDLSGIVQINGASGDGLVMDWNLYYDGGTSVSSGEPHSVTGDPSFTDEAAGDLRPKAGSPLIGAGLNVFADVPDDHEGAPRPATGAFTIGAFEAP
jgi:hypothetical protein